MQKHENKQLYMGNQKPSRVTGLSTKSFYGFSQLKLLFLSMISAGWHLTICVHLPSQELSSRYSTLSLLIFSSTSTIKCIKYSNLPSNNGGFGGTLRTVIFNRFLGGNRNKWVPEKFKKIFEFCCLAKGEF